MGKTNEATAPSGGVEKLTRSEHATARAQARLWSTDEFKRIVRDLRAKGLNAAQREVYVSELIAYLRHVDHSLVESAS